MAMAVPRQGSMRRTKSQARDWLRLYVTEEERQHPDWFGFFFFFFSPSRSFSCNLCPKITPAASPGNAPRGATAPSPPAHQPDSC